MGDLLGLSVGVVVVGDLLGLTVGFTELGDLLGLAVGMALGLLLSFSFGAFVWVRVGPAVGVAVGLAVVGDLLGLALGPVLGQLFTERQIFPLPDFFPVEMVSGAALPHFRLK